MINCLVNPLSSNCTLHVCVSTRARMTSHRVIYCMSYHVNRRQKHPLFQQMPETDMFFKHSLFNYDSCPSGAKQEVIWCYCGEVLEGTDRWCCNTSSLPTRQIPTLGQCHSTSEHDTLGTPLASVLDMSGTASQFTLVRFIVSFQNKLPSSQFIFRQRQTSQAIF